MTVIVGVKTDCVKVQGSIDELGDLNIDRESSIDMFKTKQSSLSITISQIRNCILMK